MKPHFLALTLASILGLNVQAFAATVNQFTVTPPAIQIGVAETISLRLLVSEPQKFIGSRGVLQKQDPGGGWVSVSTVLLQQSATNQSIFTAQVPDFTVSEAVTPLRVAVTVRERGRRRGQRVFSPIFNIGGGQLLQGETGGTITSSTGLQAEIPAGSLEVDAIGGIVPGSVANIPIVADGLLPLRAYTYFLTPKTGGSTSPTLLRSPHGIGDNVTTDEQSRPIPNGAYLYIAQRGVVDSLDPNCPDGTANTTGLCEGLIIVSTGTVNEFGGARELKEAAPGDPPAGQAGDPVMPGNNPFWGSMPENQAGQNARAVLLGELQNAVDGNGVLLPNGNLPGFVEGTVSDSNGARAGVLVTNDTNSLAFYTDADGKYRLPISVGATREFQVMARDPFRCSTGTTPVLTMPNPTVIPADPLVQPPVWPQDFPVLTRAEDTGVDITLAPNAGFAPTRPGLRNAGFELADARCWTVSDQAVVRPISRNDADAADQFDDLFFDGRIQPAEGDWMMVLSANDSSVEQNFRLPRLPNDDRDLHFDFTFGCVTNQACAGDSGNTARLEAEILNAAGNPLAPPLVLNQSNQNFPNFGGQLGWRVGKMSVPSSIPSGTELKIRVTARTLPSNTVILIDNFRFRTVVVDVKLVAGAMPDLPGDANASAREARVVKNVLNANELLSQVGLAVRIRGEQNNQRVREISAAIGGLDVVDIELGNTANSNLPAQPEVMTLLAERRSATAEDLNVYYVESLSATDRCNVYAIAIGPDDYTLSNELEDRGIILGHPARVRRKVNGVCEEIGSLVSAAREDFLRETFGHEVAHMVLTPGIPAGHVLEHLADLFNLAGGYRCTTQQRTEGGSILPAPPCPSRSILGSVIDQATDQAEEISIDTPQGPACPVSCPH